MKSDAKNIVGIILTIVFMAIWVGVLSAQTNEALPLPGLEGVPANLLGMPLKDIQVNLTTVGLAFMLLGRVVTALKAGGGIKGVVMGIWGGTNTPVLRRNNMKKLLLALLLTVAVLLTPSCALFQGKPVEVRAVNASDAAKVSVKAVMKAWNDWIPIGKPSLPVQAHVRKTYNAYHAAQLLLLDTALVYAEKPDPANEIALQKASANAAVALSDLVGLLRTLGLKI